MIDFISQWSHALAAILFGAIALWQVQRAPTDARGRMLMVAALATAFWALLSAIRGPNADVSNVAEHLRNLGWLGFMYALWRQGDGHSRTMTVVILYAVVTAIIVAEAMIDFLPAYMAGSPRLLSLFFLTTVILRMIVAIGALVLVHNLYTAATPDARAAIRLPMIGLAAMWIYDLNLYTISYLARDASTELFALRGVALSLIAPIFGLAALRTQHWTVRLSRTVAFQSLSLVAIGGYLVTMVLVTSALQLIGGDYARLAQVCFVFGASVAALVLLPSSKLRAWFRVKISKHLFQHRYDYRAEWIRFTETIGRPGADALALDARVIQALADVTESPGGLLLVPDTAGVLVARAQWNWPMVDPPAFAASAQTGEFFCKTGRVIELDELRRDDAAVEELRFIPEWALSDSRVWAIVPLVHFDQLIGLVLLERPSISRMLDWEDFDLLRVVGRQAASYLSEARGQETLSDAKRFEEFNRRFAFIMHDIKNLVSQLSLVTRNAERHADNPEFRVDMIATLKNSTARMNDLLARLSQHNKGRAENPRSLDAARIIKSVVNAKSVTHPVIIAANDAAPVIADENRLEQALGHLLQNAIDASPAHEPVCVQLEQRHDEILISVIDRGTGMSPAFIREKLFQPFTSTKESGFGIGAYEAKIIVGAMGGRIDVISREGEGSQFIIILPAAQSALLANEVQAA